MKLKTFLILFIFNIIIRQTTQTSIDISSFSNIDQIKQTHIDLNFNINFDKLMYLI
jgi:hypothetical protein